MRPDSLIPRVLAALMVCMLLTSVMPWLLSLYISSQSLSDPGREELEVALTQGESLLARVSNGVMTHSEAQEAVNPVLNPGSVFVILLDETPGVIAHTNGAEEYASLTRLARQTGEMEYSRTYTAHWGDVLVMARRVENTGCVVAGKPGGTQTAIGVGLGAKTAMWLAPVVIIGVLLATLVLQRAARPAAALVEAAGRVSRGEEVMVPEDLPGEIGEVGRAFNRMARDLKRNMDDLRYERDTMDLILEGLSEGILALDDKMRVLKENAAAHRLLTPAVMATVRARMRGEGGEPTGLIQSGEAVLCYVISPLPMREGRRGQVALVRDVTEQERLERTRHDYVANISHELRTPLASIRGLAEGLRDGMVDSEDDKMRYYRMMVDESRRLSRLVSDLLELSRLQSNPAAFECARVDVTEMMYDLADRNDKLFVDAGLKLTLELSTTPMPDIVSNEDRIQQALTIFLDNARKFTPSGGRVTLGAQIKGDSVYFFVRDTGIGMDENTVRHAFERFLQADPSRADKGSGLGLAIAREILERMGIAIGVMSKPGEGSEFGFSVARGADGSVKE